jgi:hypothetical protein
VQLSTYIRDTAELLNDENHLFWSVPQLTRYVNRGRYRIAQATQCIRCLITGQAPWGTSAQPGSIIPGAMVPGTLPAGYPGTTLSTDTNTFQTIAGVERYTFDYAKPFLQAQYSGVKAITDVESVSVAWGGFRPTMNWAPWADMEAYARSYCIGVTSYPFLWSSLSYGERGDVWLFPIPSVGVSDVSVGGQGLMDWLVNCVPKDLYSDNDPDAIPEPFSRHCCLYGASWGYLRAKRYEDARILQAQLADELGIDVFSSDSGKVPDFYWTAP